ncbi:MAG: aromatic acid exporter family protein [Clostridiales bacterium]|jgi:uncharacterized membrane protein YgaE (UPF0421/DUF939 family)|nr:aromatic acid exporter family protein [Clostridiales bacterium]
MFKRFRLGGRVLKTSLAVGLTIYILQSIGIERVSLAAIVAVVTVQRTFYRSIQQSLAKLGSVLLGAVVGTVFGMVMGPTPLAYALVVYIVIISCLRLRWQDSIAVTAVTAIGVIASQAQSLTIYSLQQIFSALLGGIVALSINFLFTPNHKNEVVEHVLHVDESIRDIMLLVAGEILHPSEFSETFYEQVEHIQSEIIVGLEMSKLFREEQRFNLSEETLADRYREIFRIFESQIDRLQEMHKLAKRMVTEVPQAVPVAKLLRILVRVQKKQLQGKMKHYEMLDRAIANLETSFVKMDLPVTRDEFISRSSLVHLFRETKKYYSRIRKMPYL